MSTFLSSKDGIKARRPHRCSLCGEQINAGELYDKRTGVDCGDVRDMHLHPECHIHENRDGTMNPDWYEDISEPAFSRAEALAAQREARK